MKYSFLLIFFTCSLWFCKEIAPSSKPSGISHPLVKEIEEKPETIRFFFDYDTAKWTDLAFAEPSIIIDLKYATTDNFVKEKMYECSRCFLRPDVAQAVLKVHRKLQLMGMGLKMLDCYRPSSVQQKLWDKVPNASYVTPPSKGSMHNRGAAVDITIVDDKGKELNMGTPYDFFGLKAHHDFTDLPKEILNNRQLLRKTMATFGLKHIRTEWWHYSFMKKDFELSDMIWNCPQQ